VCTTELGYVARLKPEFDRRSVKAIGLSIDPVDAHAKWSEDIRATQGQAPNFPIVADPDRKVAKLYGMMHPAHDEVYTVRTVFVIDPKKKIRLMITYPRPPAATSTRSCASSTRSSSPTPTASRPPSTSARAKTSSSSPPSPTPKPSKNSRTAGAP
jgi:alkyl hydroperoxide reductase subunit AhpC